MTLCGCGGTQVVLTTGFNKDEIFIVGSESCSIQELEIYLTNIQNTYQNVYGEEIWNVTSDGVTFEDSIKNTALAELAQVKTLYLMAMDRGLTLDPETKILVANAAREYYASLNDAEIEAMGASEELIEEMYSQIALAQSAYDEIIGDISPEISDDEARYVRVRIIYMRTAYRNGDSLIPYTNSDYERVYATLNDIRTGLLDGTLDFETEAARYNEADETVISFGKGMVDPALEEEAFSLAGDEISDIVKTSDGLYLMQCISTLDRTQTDANKVLITEKLRDEAFETVYDEYLDSLIRNLNTELWKTVTLNTDPQIKTCNFFEIYDNYLGSGETDG
ncbi:MAG: peptidylprolyl isomerase [Lachnospiraceae bacterium]|nr:peptidylprolyl isomerase [Lachnospiraceae bacterium]MBO7530657.1 peptidylprolyl isomerase [Lachnospiraceae bacterium]MBP5703019.1 peptidylprolyl isomerase [Lachnospiraceae bacterium]MBP5763266.1 peptidylprolyl isomerase [Lachnospiraceae bacterium]